MMEDPQIIRLYVRHYRELLKLDRHIAVTRQHVIDLPSETQAQLMLAKASRNR